MTQEDSCGVCGGDDSSCDFYNGQIQVLKHRNSGKKLSNLNPIIYTFESIKTTKKGYRPLLVLPKDSRSVNITKLSGDSESSYLAIKNKKGYFYP